MSSNLILMFGILAVGALVCIGAAVVIVLVVLKKKK